MDRFAVFYRKQIPYPWELEHITRDNFRYTHVLVNIFEASCLEAVFVTMQGENWSPNGEISWWLKMLDFTNIHTSMSVGDIALNLNTKKAFMVTDDKWKELLPRP